MIYPLSPIDHVFTGLGSYPIEFAFFFRADLEEARLIDGLRRTIEGGFEPVSSMLCEAGGGGRLGLRPDPDGARVTSAVSRAADVSFQDGKGIRSYLDHVRTIPGEPLTRIRFTRTPRGTVLGVSISHAIADGFSYFYFLTNWARTTRGESPIRRPFLDRSVLSSNLFGTDQAAADTVSDTSASGFFSVAERADPEPENVEWDYLRWSKETLDGLLEEGRRTSSVRLTYNDVITAQLWRTYVPRWRPADADGSTPTAISCPVDFRRLVKALSRDYFGNAVCLATALVSYDALAERPLGDLAEAIHRAVAGTRGPEAGRSVAGLEAVQDRAGIAGLQSLQVMHPKHGLLVTNLSRVPLTELDFGGGPPDRIAVGTPVHRGALVLPATDGVAIHVAHPMGRGRA